MDKQYVLVKGDVNYADEFDCHAFQVTTKDKWTKHLTKVKKILDALPKDKYGYPQEIEKYFGTNEALMFDSFDNYERSFTVKEISEETAKELHTLFSYGVPREFSWGTGNYAMFEFDDNEEELDEDK